MADLGGVPGAGRISEIQRQLQVDAGALGAAGARWIQGGTAATATADTLASKVSALDAAWDGAGAEAAVAYATALREAFGTVQPAAETIASALEQAAQALTAARDAVEAIAAKVAAAVAALPPGDPADKYGHDAAVAAIVAPAVAEAENALHTAVTALREATGQVTAACGQTPLHSLPPIGEQAFQPAQFSPAAWQPGADQPAAETFRQSSAGSSAGSSGSGANMVGAGNSWGGSLGGDIGGQDAAGGDVGGGPPSGGGRAAPAQVQQWIDEAIAILRAQGVPVDKMSREDIWTIIEHESGGNPQAINNWDSNATKGTPSKGLMQTIGPTFASYALPGHGDIWNPVDNIIAGVRYSISRYGSVSNVPGVAGMRGGSGYVGY